MANYLAGRAGVRAHNKVMCSARTEVDRDVCNKGGEYPDRHVLTLI